MPAPAPTTTEQCTAQLQALGAQIRTRRKTLRLSATETAEAAGLSLSAATLAVMAATLYYLRLDLRFGVVMGLLLAACLAFAQATASWSTTAWATLGVGLFVVGWVIQFVGHIFEGRKPAFVDDIMGLIIGPLFVVAELAFLLGLRREVEAVVASRAGPVRAGRALAK